MKIIRKDVFLSLFFISSFQILTTTDSDQQTDSDQGEEKKEQEL